MSRKRLLAPSVVVYVWAISAPMAAAQDPVVVDAKHYKVELENEHVRVLRVTYGPGEKSPMHTHRPHVFAFITPGHFRFGLPGGQMQDAAAGKPGDAGWADTSLTHAPENIGATPVELVLVEVKQKGSAQFKHAAPDPAKLRPEQFSVLVENENVRVLRNRVTGGRPGFQHEHPNNVVIRISGGRADQKPGDVAWAQGPQKHGDANTPSVAGEVLIVELKTAAGSKPTS